MNSTNPKQKPTCKFCDHEIAYSLGWMLIEDDDGGFMCHEECYQMSGQDEGYIEELYKELEEDTNDFTR